MTKQAGLKTTTRIRGIDICRSVAILLAMWSHVLVAFDVKWSGDSFHWLRFIMQMAPVVFICLFGSMLEFAYAQKFTDGRVKQAVDRLLLRAGQCWLLYAVSVVALIVSSQYSLGYGLRTILMAGITPFTDILKFYACALVIAPALIVFRIRYGLWPLLAFAIVVQASHPLLDMMSYTSPETGKDYLGPILGFLYGGSDAGVGAPSFLHGMTLVCVGMVLGYAVRNLFSNDAAQIRRGLIWVSAVLGASLITAIMLWTQVDNVLIGISDLSIRNTNSPFYYALGLSSTTAFLLVCLYLFDVRDMQWANGIRFIGMTSLFTFCFGNVLLYLQPFDMTSEIAYLLALLFATLIPLQSWIFSWLVNTDNGRSSRVGWLVMHVMRLGNAFISWLVTPLRRIYRTCLDDTKLVNRQPLSQ